MNIVHLALQAPYNEGWGYQENLLPKYQVKAGHQVTLIITTQENSSDGTFKEIEPCDYISPDGFRVIRLKRKRKNRLLKKIYNILCLYDIYDLLISVQPDFIMVHGLGSFSSLQVRKYVKKYAPMCTVIADNHEDYNNSGVLSRNRFKHNALKWLWKQLNSVMNRYYKKVYGVSPKRVEIIHTVFGFPAEKTDLLPAGADNDMIDFENRQAIREKIRSEHGILENDFLIVTGGKIDEKKNIDHVMDAISRINRDDVKLIVFGNCTESFRSRIESLAEHRCIRYIGWISAKDTYKYFLSADLVVFPGLHSVMWEQACASKVPCLFHRLDGFNHVDVGGNCAFLDDITPESIAESIKALAFTDSYYEMKTIALSSKTDIFLYSEIAAKSLETA